MTIKRKNLNGQKQLNVVFMDQTSSSLASNQTFDLNAARTRSLAEATPDTFMSKLQMHLSSLLKFDTTTNEIKLAWLWSFLTGLTGNDCHGYHKEYY